MLALVAVASAWAFVVAPRVLAGVGTGTGFGGRAELVEAMSASFDGYWASGRREPAAGLASVIEYWARYHVAKAALAGMLLAVFGLLAVRLWRAYARSGGSGRGRRAALASGGGAAAGLAVFALVTVMANVQGAITPFASLLPMLPADGTLAEARRNLAAAPGGPHPPALDLMIEDFARYHAVMAVIAAVVAAALLLGGALLWRATARTERSARSARRVLGTFGILAALLAAALVVVAVANTGTAADPSPAFLAFLEGGW
ncbi:hypothetical protein [Actinocorallia herbida]|uniref:hypothetical protein n=1 Tax=Actinocorallia herbida TaxID=58109 RepID=UPI000F4CF4E4|nr:hypothetical protein [Actinocorallia herbida]